jgi:hypothetical protein
MIAWSPRLTPPKDLTVPKMVFVAIGVATVNRHRLANLRTRDSIFLVALINWGLTEFPPTCVLQSGMGQSGRPLMILQDCCRRWPVR